MRCIREWMPFWMAADVLMSAFFWGEYAALQEFLLRIGYSCGLRLSVRSVFQCDAGSFDWFKQLPSARTALQV